MGVKFSPRPSPHHRPRPRTGHHHRVQPSGRTLHPRRHPRPSTLNVCACVRVSVYVRAKAFFSATANGNGEMTFHSVIHFCRQCPRCFNVFDNKIYLSLSFSFSPLSLLLSLSRYSSTVLGFSLSLSIRLYFSPCQPRTGHVHPTIAYTNRKFDTYF